MPIVDESKQNKGVNNNTRKWLQIWNIIID